MREFSNFSIYMTADQCRQAVQFLDNEEQLIQFFVASYNAYIELHSEANLSVITNPDALFRTKEESDTLVYELKQYIRDTVGIPYKEEVKDNVSHRRCSTRLRPTVGTSSNNTSNTAKAKNIKNPR